MAGGLGGPGGTATVTAGCVGAGALDRRFNGHRRGFGGEDVPARPGVFHILALGQLVEVQRGIDARVGELFRVRPLRAGAAAVAAARLDVAGGGTGRGGAEGPANAL